MGRLRELISAFPELLADKMQQQGELMCQGMRQRLMGDNKSGKAHYETGALLDSIRSETEQDDDTVTTYIYADAKSPDGIPYAEFIEYGTGQAHTGHGKSGYWYYKDRNGNWRMTNGMDADPFIEPSALEIIDALDDMFAEIDVDIRKYKGWKAND